MTREEAISEFNGYVELREDGWIIKKKELRNIINEIYNDLESRTCTNCHWYHDEVCCEDSSPLWAEFVDKNYGCNLFKLKDKQ